VADTGGTTTSLFTYVSTEVSATTTWDDVNDASAGTPGTHCRILDTPCCYEKEATE
jgi:hypothetical protein